MARGGKREGAGRKPGALTMRTREAAETLAAEGLTPLGYLLSLVRDEDLTREERVDAAKAAAPYVHPRLSAVAVDGSMTVEDYGDIPDDELACRLAALAARFAGGHATGGRNREEKGA